MSFRININFSFKDLTVNRLIRLLVIADLLFWSGWGFITPILALFIVERIAGATIVTVGVASAIYWAVKAIFQMPVALYLDKHEGERDDFHALVSGLILAGFAAISFVLVKTVAELYFIVFLQALAFGLYTPSWSAIFSRHLDKKNYAFDWSLDNTVIGIALGITAMVGSTLAATFGFNIIFVSASILSFASAIVLLFVPNLILPAAKKNTEPPLFDHNPRNIGK
jgi:MFS family permease